MGGGEKLEAASWQACGDQWDDYREAWIEYCKRQLIGGEGLPQTTEQLSELFDEFAWVSSEQFRRDEGKTKNCMCESGWGGDPFFDRKVAYLPMEGEAIFVGDTHGDVESTRDIIEDSGFLEAMASGENKYMVFMGDYIDRGKYNIDNLATVLRLKTMFPDNVVVLQGNHDRSHGVKRDFAGMAREFVDKFGLKDDEEDLYDWLIAQGRGTESKKASLLGDFYLNKLDILAENFMQDYAVTANGIFAVHGGIPVSFGQGRLEGYASLNGANELYYGFTEDGVPYDKLPYLDTPQCQYQWNDFHVGNGVQENDERRGGYIVGSDVLDEFLGAVGLNVIFHAHSPNRDEFIPGRELLVFSAGGHEGSNYSTFQNRGYYTVDLAVPITDVAVARQHKVV